MSKLELVKVKSYKIASEESTSASGSGSQRSHEDENTMMRKTTATTKAIVEDCDCDPDCGDLLRRKSAQAAAAIAAL